MVRTLASHWRTTALIVVVVLAGGVVAVGAREARLDDAASSAAIVAVDGDDPAVGTHASCDYAPGLSLVLLRARYHCVVKACDSVIGRVDMTHVVRGGWSYDVRFAVPPYGRPKRGNVDTGPPPTLEPGTCEALERK